MANICLKSLTQGPATRLGLVLLDTDAPTELQTELSSVGVPPQLL